MTRQSMFQAKKESQPLKTSSLFRRQAAQTPAAEQEPAFPPIHLGQDHSAIPFKPVHPAPALGPSSICCPFTPQRCPFGGACHACPPKMQAKLKIGQPGDRYEQEADRVAEQVMRMPEPQVQRKCSAPGCKDEEEKKLLQTKPANAENAGAQVDHPLIQSVLSSPGQPLDAGTRSFMEPRFGQDFSGVRVHVGGEAAESARAVNARAYTVGRDVVFGEGQYAPGSDEGKRLMAHELVHVGQQVNQIQCDSKQHNDLTNSFRGFIENIANDVQNDVKQNNSNKAFHKLNGLWIRDMINVLEIINQNIGLDVLIEKFDEADEYVKPRIGIAINSIKDFPEGQKKADEFESAKPQGSTIEQENFKKVQQEFKSQKQEVLAFKDVLNWPDLLFFDKKISISEEKRSMIVDFIDRKRSMIKNNDGLFKPKNKKEGYEYDGDPQKKDPEPNLVDADQRKTQINKIIWKELAGEGSSAAINTYDGQLLTWGRGFAAKGQLEKKMEILFSKENEIKNKLLQAGITYQSGKWLAVNTDSKIVKEGSDALKLIRENLKILSLLIQVAEDPKYRENVVAAEVETLKSYAGAVPSWAYGWTDQAIAFAAHCVHWGGSWNIYKDTNGDIMAIAKIKAKNAHDSHKEKSRGGATLIIPSATRTFLSFAGGALKKVLTTPMSLPVDIDTSSSYNGHVFLNAGKNELYYHIS